MEQEKAFVALKVEVSSSTSENEQFSITATSFDDSKSGNHTITDLSSDMPSIADGGLSQETLTELIRSRAVPATTFLCFSHLPLELRYKIWRHSFPRQHLILSEHSFMRPLSSPFRHMPSSLFRTHVNLPMASATRESRAETLKHYYALYQENYRVPRTTSSSVFQVAVSGSNDYLSGATDLLLPRVMYFNPNIDCLILMYWDVKAISSDLHDIFPPYNQEIVRCLESIREVRVYHVKLGYPGIDYTGLNYTIDVVRLLNIIKRFKNLQRIYLILHKYARVHIDDQLHREFTNRLIKKHWTGQAELEIVWGKEGEDGV